MALPASGPVSMSMIRTELENTGITSNLSLTLLGSMSGSGATRTSGYTPINQSSTNKPSPPFPASIGEWYGFDYFEYKGCGSSDSFTLGGYFTYAKYFISGAVGSTSTTTMYLPTNPGGNTIKCYIYNLATGRIRGDFPFTDLGGLPVNTPSFNGTFTTTTPQTYSHTFTSSPGATTRALYIMAWDDSASPGNYEFVISPACGIIGTTTTTTTTSTTTTTTTGGSTTTSTTTTTTTAVPTTSTTTTTTTGGSTTTSTTTTTTTAAPTTSTTTTTTTAAPTTSTTTTTTTAAPTTSTTTTTTTAISVNCGTGASFSGGVAYPTTRNVVLGSTTGIVNMSFDTYGVPDWLILEWNSNVAVNTGYRGTTNYDYGGVTRSTFNNSLTGKIDPIYNTTYPDTTNYPLDGYPRVSLPLSSSLSFDKNLSSPTNATLKVYSPLSGTDWITTISCPATTTTTSTTTTTTTQPIVYNYYTFSPCAGGSSIDFRSPAPLGLGEVYAFQASPPQRACYTITDIFAAPNTNDLPLGLSGPKANCSDSDCIQL